MKNSDSYWIRMKIILIGCHPERQFIAEINMIDLVLRE